MKFSILLAIIAFANIILPADKVIFKLDQGEYIVSSESQLKVGGSGTEGFSIITKKGNKFFVNTEKGKAGPFEKVPLENLPPSGIRKSDVYQFEEPGDKDGKPEMGMTPQGNMTIKVDNKVIATLPPGEVPSSIAIDKKRNRLAYVTMVADNDGNLAFTATQMPGGKKFQVKGPMMVMIKKNEQSGNFIFEGMEQDGKKTFYTEAGNKQGPFSMDAKAFELYDNKTIVVMEPGKDQQNNSVTNIIKDGKVIHTLKNTNSDSQLLFSGDATKYCVVSASGLEFSDGSKIPRGILPTVEKSATGTKLHYLHINENNEVIQSTIPW
ncbi:hypothetical protein [Flavihumibacter profundi]|jgi:hypothetical protein|uniref:hypothetical protein n=1 Tax=Flavihumibacter profundi TaxID=2716883 RepID=UPI001CC81455|nr:hypothetical protein [Flavihumibacter profundi]MBZ5858288.1 hypothetical protein [Flavihumibacter profundi]